jgi:hypothetical protein
MKRTYPDSNIGYAGGELVWLDGDDKPVIKVGVDREMDVPGVSTPAASAVRQAQSAEAQHARMWPVKAEG